MTHASSASAQTSSDIDSLNLALNVEYLVAQFLNTAIGQVIPADRISGGGQPGVAPVAGRQVTFWAASATTPVTAIPTDLLLLRAIVSEMASDNRAHLFPMRVIVGASVARQPLMDLSVGATAPFSIVMQRAGVVPPGTVFDPYASEENLLYALFFLKGLSVAAYRGLGPTISNRVVLQSFAGLLAAEAMHAATIRNLLYTRGATLPRMRTNADAIAAFQRSLNGGNVFQGVSRSDRTFAGGTAAVEVANTTPVLPNGEVGGRTSGQILNQLYLTNTAATSGGFFPSGVSGGIRTSASA